MVKIFPAILCLGQRKENDQYPLGGEHMGRGFALKAWVYFLCVSFLLLGSGFHTMVAGAKETGRPLGEMVSRGEVKFESRTGVWKDVEPSQFPIFPGMRIKTGKGGSLINLEGNCQIEVGENSLLSFDRNGQIQLTWGTIDFRLPATAKLGFKVGDLTVIQWKSLQAPENEATAGSISLHSDGAVTVKNLRGNLSVLNQERAVLAALSSNDAITFPSVMVKAPSKAVVAQADEKTSDDEDETRKFLGIPWWIWAASGVVVAGAVIAVAASGGGGGGGHGYAVPVCP